MEMSESSRNHKNFSNLLYSLLRAIIGFFIKLIWVRKVDGRENIPKNGSVIIALNHQSYFDFLCFASISPRNVYFLTAEKFFNNRKWKLLMEITGQIKVERKSKDKEAVHSTVLSYLKNGRVVGIFPEGTRSPHSNTMLPAYTGVVKYALKAGVQIVPVGINGTYEVMSRHDERPRFKKIVDIHIGKPINFSKLQDQEVGEDEFRIKTDQVMSKISELSGRSYIKPGEVGVLNN